MSGLNIKSLVLVVLCIISIQSSFAQNKEYKIDREIFELPEHGEIQIDVPRVWNYNFTKSGTDSPPLITFYVLDQSDEEIFQLNMSFLWNRGYEKNITSNEYILSLVKKTGESVLPYSDEVELNLQQIDGIEGNGYLFDLTDSNAGPGEYKYLTQGAITVGEVVLIFSLFSNDEQSLLRDATIRSIKSAKHILEKSV